METLVDVFLALLLIAMGGWAVVAREARSAVIIFIIYGLLLSLVWVRIAAVDVALTEAAIGSGVTGMLLITAAARLRPAVRTAFVPGLPFRVIAGVFCAAIAGGIAVLPLYAGPPASLAAQAVDNLASSGLGNPVAGVLFVYRAFDTLLEKVVLLLALLGVWSLAPDKFWGGIPGLKVIAERDSALVFLARTLPPVGIMFAIYMTWVGADGPGGAFQGGTVLAAMWILVMMAGLWPVPPIQSRPLRIMLLAGPAIFLVIGLAGFVLADAFLAYPSGFAKLLIIVVEFALTLSIGVALGLLAAGPPERAPPT
ncbi:hydrogenase subunit MbhD domain-containing protein [Aestuariivirga sp.]|uniref:hydrogenase subunit MbhD domain-containing protein n=1 Tax=Aestuariivirga sp. TaxID=2650926 RepID=UPI003BAA02B4